VDLSDEALIEKYRVDGDLTVFRVLVKRYQSRIFSQAYRTLGNPEEAEEVVQDTFVKVHQNLEKYRQQSNFSSWIFRITHNLCMDALRVRQRRKDMSAVSFDPQSALADEEGDKSLNQFPDFKPGPSQQLDQIEQYKVIEDSLLSLPETQKSVVVLHDIQGFSYQEIAEIVGTSIGTVRSRLHYGRLKLKEMLDPYFANDKKNTPATSR
jgi:RNA polymerase sigma-70 factor, ECF subfamily